jgi:hypothetical protein
MRRVRTDRKAIVRPQTRESPDLSLLLSGSFGRPHSPAELPYSNPRSPILTWPKVHNVNETTLLLPA